MKDFYEKLKGDIKNYEGRHDEFIFFTPEWYKLMTNLLDDPRLPYRLKPLVSCAIAYFIIPVDIISEEIHGPYGYVDDIFFCAFVANEIVKRTNDPGLLVENWESEGNIVELVHQMLEKENELIGANKNLILNYTGCLELLKLLDGCN
jgi:uncharacterized membrane protein YkvA (DUF1232 family)